MKSLELTYQNGHFYKVNSDGSFKRVQFKEGLEFCMVSCEKEPFEETQNAGRWPLKIKSSEELHLEIEKNTDITAFKILNKGEELCFDIGIGSKTYIFVAELLEDLYLYKKVSDKVAEFRAYDCCCVTITNKEGGIKFFEKVYGKSLNDLYKSTYIHYFENKGNPASNIFITFCLSDGQKLDSLRKDLTKT